MGGGEMKLSAKAQSAMDKVVARLQSGDLSPVVEIIRTGLPDDAPAKKWSFANRVMAFAQTESLDCRGFKQWKSVGRHVTKGSSAAYILGPCTIKKETDDGEERAVLIGFRALPVFAYHQTEGDDLAGHQYEPRQLPPLVDAAERLGVEVEWEPTAPGYLGWCEADGKKIRVGTHDASVFFHELAHAAHASLNGNGKLKGGQHADQETAAELTAVILMEAYGYEDRSGNAWRYIKNYNKKDPLMAVVKALADVERILEVLEV